MQATHEQPRYSPNTLPVGTRVVNERRGRMYGTTRSEPRFDLTGTERRAMVWVDYDDGAVALDYLRDLKLAP